LTERTRVSEFHPDAWPPVIVRDPAKTQEILTAAAGDKYTYRQLDDFTDLIKRTLLTVPQVSKVDRSGIRGQRVFLESSQGRLAAYGLKAGNLPNLLGARNITAPGGILETGGKNITLDPSGEFTSEADIGDVMVGAGSAGSPIYLRDLVTVVRSYDSPAQFLNFLTRRGPDGSLRRH